MSGKVSGSPESIEVPRLGDAPESLLAGIVVVDLTADAGAMAARMLGDLGAEVVRPVPPTGDALDAQPTRAAAWCARTQRVPVTGAEDPALDTLLTRADVVLDTPRVPGAWALDPGRAPAAVWVSLTPFGLDGPRAKWRASDLGIMAASGNLYCTGEPDRAPVRCAEPAGYAHSAAEAAFAALTALASGRPQRVDVAAQEVVAVANMATPARFPATGFRGTRRGANIGRTREIWPTQDGFVSFGLRGGKARVPSLETLTRLVDTDTLRAMNWAEFSPNTADDQTLRAIETDVAAFFARHTMRELYAIACETNLMLAPINSPAEILASEQLAAREFFGELPGGDRLPRSFVTVRRADGDDDTASAPLPVTPGRGA